MSEEYLITFKIIKNQKVVNNRTYRVEKEKYHRLKRTLVSWMKKK